MNSLRIRKKKNIKIVDCKFFALLFDQVQNFIQESIETKL